MVDHNGWEAKVETMAGHNVWGTIVDHNGWETLVDQMVDHNGLSRWLIERQSLRDNGWSQWSPQWLIGNGWSQWCLNTMLHHNAWSGLIKTVDHNGWPQWLTTTVDHNGWPQRLITTIGHNAWGALWPTLKLTLRETKLQLSRRKTVLNTNTNPCGRMVAYFLSWGRPPGQCCFPARKCYPPLSNHST